MTDKFPSYVKAYQYRGGFNKFVYDKLKELSGSSEEEENTETPQETTRDISFTINDGTDPIQGATVTIGSENKTTGSAGGCNFTGIADGEISVTVEKEGYTTKTETITVSSSNTSFTISLVASG